MLRKLNLAHGVAGHTVAIVDVNLGSYAPQWGSTVGTIAAHQPYNSFSCRLVVEIGFELCPVPELSLADAPCRRGDDLTNGDPARAPCGVGVGGRQRGRVHPAAAARERLEEGGGEQRAQWTQEVKREHRTHTESEMWCISCNHQGILTTLRSPIWDISTWSVL